MTYPPQPGYAPPPQQQQYAPQAPALPVMPTVIEPTSGGGGEISPQPRHLIGYAVMCLPTSIDENAPGLGPGAPPRPKVTTDVIVVGVDPQGNPLPPVEYGDNQSNNMADRRPNCYRLDAFPAEFRGVWWSNSEVVKALRGVLQAGPGNVTMGRFRFGDQGNRPPLLEPMADNDPARVALLEAWQQRAQNRDALRRSSGNGITEINGGPPQKAPAQAQQGYPPQPGSAYAQAPPPAPGYGYPPAPQQGYGGPPPPPGQVQYAPAPPPMPAQPSQAGPVPPGWTPEAWAAAPPHIRNAYGQA